MSKFNRRLIVTHEPTGYRADLRVEGVGYDYNIEAHLTYGLKGRVLDVTVAKEDIPAGGVLKHAVALTKAAISEAVKQARESQTWVIVEGLPGYSQADVDDTGMTIVSYDMDHKRHMPTTVYRVLDESRVQAFLQQVSGKDFSEHGDGEFGLSKTTVTTDASSLSDYSWGVQEGLTSIAIEQAEAQAHEAEALDNALDGLFEVLGIEDTPENRAAVLALRTPKEDQ